MSILDDDCNLWPFAKGIEPLSSGMTAFLESTHSKGCASSSVAGWLTHANAAAAPVKMIHRHQLRVNQDCRHLYTDRPPSVWKGLEPDNTAPSTMNQIEYGLTSLYAFFMPFASVAADRTA
jgi:hypothetical protein